MTTKASGTPRSIFLGLLFLLDLLAGGCATTGSPASQATAECTQKNTAITQYEQIIASASPALVQALRNFPKGGDLHNHLSGTIMPEDYIAMGKKAGYCYDTSSYKITNTCPNGTAPLAKADRSEIEKLKQSLSMFQYDYPNIQGGHDHFFDAFGKFRAVSKTHQGMMLAKLLEQASDDNVSYVETMMSAGSKKDIKRLYQNLTQRFPNKSDYTNSQNYPAMYSLLAKHGLNKIISQARNEIHQYQKTAADVLHCNSRKAEKACAVTYRFQASANRNPSTALPNATLFIQAAIDFSLSKADPRVVGVNLVSGEDLPVSMNDFNTQMDIYHFLHKKFPKVNIALHAGEITPCFVGKGNPALYTHIARSLDAGATRIGHGISFEYLSSQQQATLASKFKHNRAAVEVPMTSNAQILGVAGQDHPFPLYFEKYNVPVTFATDDEGVSYNNFTNEWVYAWKEYKLTLSQLETLARNSLQYSFLPGDKLWLDISDQKINPRCSHDVLGQVAKTHQCKTFLSHSQKAAIQWQYEIELRKYLERNRQIPRG